MGLEKKVKALLVLLGDEDVSIARAARNKLIELNLRVVCFIEKNLVSLPFRVRLRAMQVINIVKTTSRKEIISPYISSGERKTV
jgi:hypothetical protein